LKIPISRCVQFAETADTRPQDLVRRARREDEQVNLY
jgi:hypothetical protein